MQAVRTYNKREVITFAKTTGPFGGLSNMAKDFPIFVNENIIDSVEALYQALKFPFYPDIQYQILSQSNPMLAKRISRLNQNKVRSDWNNIRFTVMEWCLNIKLLQNWESFGQILHSTGRNTIVEYSVKDPVWGAVPIDDVFLKGVNAMGRLLMKVREQYVINGERPIKVSPPNVIGLLLYGVPVSTVFSTDYYFED